MDMGHAGRFAACYSATTVRARAYIEVKGTIFCNSCGKEFGALHMRDDMLVHIHRNWFNKRLEDAC